jgi:hypothetical protein
MLRTALACGALARSRATAACSAVAQRRDFASPGDFDLIADEKGTARVEGCAPSALHANASLVARWPRSA